MQPPPPLSIVSEGLCLRLPVELRPLAAIRYPRSTLHYKPAARDVLVTVGDRVTSDAFREGLEPIIAVYDCREVRSRRSCPETGSGRKRIRVWNPPATITWSSIRGLLEAVELARRGVGVDVVVEGEEDLLVLPLALLVDNGWTIAYGQPSVGVVHVRVDGYAKRLAQMLLEGMGLGRC